jgi:hypothetical protein
MLGLVVGLRFHLSLLGPSKELELRLLNLKDILLLNLIGLSLYWPILSRKFWEIRINGLLL